MEIKQKFYKQTGVDLYKGFELFGLELGTIILNDEILEIELKNNPEGTIKTINELAKLINKNQLNENKRREEAIIYSILRSTEGQHRINKQIFFVSNLIDINTIKKILIKNQTTCFNPAVLLNNNNLKTCKSIFKPSKSFLERYDFIKPKYVSGGYKILYYEIDIQLLKETPDIYIHENDIENIYINMYHPYVWGLIQKNNLHELII